MLYCGELPLKVRGTGHATFVQSTLYSPGHSGDAPGMFHCDQGYMAFGYLFFVPLYFLRKQGITLKFSFKISNHSLNVLWGSISS